MAGILTPEEEAQLKTTIEMFEVIVQAQPDDFQSWEILKEAYSKLGREDDALNASKKIAEAYLKSGQLSSAILEYETILQKYPDDPDVKKALEEIESKASAGFARIPSPTDTDLFTKGVRAAAQVDRVELNDGRDEMYRLFVDSKIISPTDFDLCWQKVDLRNPPERIIEPFLLILHERNIAPVEKTIKLLCEKTRFAFIPLDKYDIDVELARSFPKEICMRWCVLPFDRMSKTVMVATTNPFNIQALEELKAATPYRILWYITTPQDLVKQIRKVYRI
jgi:tetratricopeptide (TPR) repeat protein